MAEQELKQREQAAALELELKRAAAEEERERRRKNDEEDRDRKRKCDENAKATLEDTRRENIRALERRVRAAPSKLEIADEISQLAELYVKNGDSKDMQRGRRRVADLWRRSRPTGGAAAPPPSAPPVPAAVPLKEIPACGVDVFDASYVFDDEADEGVYVMAQSLEEDCEEYVGWSEDPTRRTQDHARGTGGAGDAAQGFTFRRPLLTTEKCGTDREEVETLKRMLANGFGRVQGAQYVGPFRNLKAAFDTCCQKWKLCYHCGESGHYRRNLDNTSQCANARFDPKAAPRRR